MWETQPNPSVRWVQLSLLVVLTAFIGAMWGLERTTVPLIAQQEFGIASVAVTLSFIVGFGLTKSFANLFAGGLPPQLGWEYAASILFAICFNIQPTSVNPEKTTEPSMA